MRVGTIEFARESLAHQVGRRDGNAWNVRFETNEIVIALTGNWILRDAELIDLKSTTRILDMAGDRTIKFDSSGLGHWDSSLLVFMSNLRLGAGERKLRLLEDGLPPATIRLLALTGEARPLPRVSPDNPSLVSRVGDITIGTWNETVSVATLIGDTVLSGGTAVTGRLRMRGTDLLTCIYASGASALPIVTIVNVLIGGIVAFVGAVQLKRFGAGIYIADLVGVAVVREMAALITAIVMAGRTGGAYAAEIATMRQNEEIDALRVIGVPIHDYLILPRMLALITMMPLLYLYGCVVGIFGGFLVAVAMLGMSPVSFISETRASLAGNQLLFGLVKSIAFGALIAIVGCRAGLRAGRSAADVGQAATTAVVAGIVGVITLDGIFAVCANSLGL